MGRKNGDFEGNPLDLHGFKGLSFGKRKNILVFCFCFCVFASKTRKTMEADLGMSVTLPQNPTFVADTQLKLEQTHCKLQLIHYIKKNDLKG